MILVNPHTGGLVDVPKEYVDQFLGAGFKEQEPEVVEPKRPARRTTRKTTD